MKLSACRNKSVFSKALMNIKNILTMFVKGSVLKLPLPGKKLFSNTKSLHILLRMDFLLQFVH